MAKKVKSKKKHKREDEDENEDIDDEDEDEDDEDVDDEEEDDDDEDDDDEDEKPRKKKKVVKKKKKSRDDDEDEDDEDDDEDEDESEDEDDDDDDRPSKKSNSSWFSNDEKDLKGGSGYTKFEEEDGHDVMFLSDKLFVFKQHYILNPKGISSLTYAGEDSPFAEYGIKASPRCAIYALVDGKPTTITEGTRFGQALMRQKKRKGTLKNKVFVVTKVGKNTETNWEIEYKEKASSKLQKIAEAALKKKPDFLKRYAPMNAKEQKKVINERGKSLLADKN
jgi:hypothetical protein